MNKSDLKRNMYQLSGKLGKKGYDWWWHSFTGYHKQTGEERSFFIEYFIINPKLGKDVPIFGQMHNKTTSIMPSYIMIKVGTWGNNAKQIHRFFPLMQMKLGKDNLQLEIGDCFLSETAMSGNVSVSAQDVKEHPEYLSDSGDMKWDLTMQKEIAYNVGYGASKFFRNINAFAMYWHAEGMKTTYSGNVSLDGEVYEIIPEKSYGYADKNWGQDFTSPWIWISSCHIKSLISGKILRNSVFDIGGGCPKVFGIPLNRKLLIDFFYEGEEFEFNFSKFWTKTKTMFKCYETDNQLVWKICTQNRNAKLHITCTCKKNEMLLINYESPDGYKRFSKLWNGGNGKGKATLYRKNKGKLVMVDKVAFKNAGCEFGEYD